MYSTYYCNVLTYLRTIIISSLAPPGEARCEESLSPEMNMRDSEKRETKTKRTRTILWFDTVGRQENIIESAGMHDITRQTTAGRL